jgi:hypothetical protein
MNFDVENIEYYVGAAAVVAGIAVSVYRTKGWAARWAILKPYVIKYGPQIVKTVKAYLEKRKKAKAG